MMITRQAQRSTQEISEAESALRLLMEFIDLSRDLERNHEDSLFRDAGKEIIYVLDENIFEIFFQPKERRHLVRSFHSARFAGKNRPDLHWRSFEAQLALIASEYLLSGSLPGVERPFLYMTLWHREELANRIDDLSNELSTQAHDDIHQAAAELELKLKAMRALESSSDGVWEWSGGEDPWLDRDLRELRSAGATEEALRRFALTRVAAGILASNEIHEPIDQLRRAVTRPLSGRYRSFHLDFPANDRERGEIRKDAHMWYRLLGQERNNARESIGWEGERTDGSLWFDAQALALVRWAATQRARDDQRIVFVTGDSILFNAYRRWYVENALSDLTYAEDFLLRRIPQYSPILNISDSENDISRQKVAEGSRRIFALINEIIEIALLPFNLARLANARDQARDAVIMRGREYLVMKMLDAKKLSDDDTIAFFTRGGKPLVQMLPKMWNVLDQLRSTERMAIGAFFPYISQRMNEDHRKIAQQLTRSGEAGSAKILRNYLTGVLDQLVTDSLKGWLSVALESVRHFAFDGAGLPRRIPLTVWYPIRQGVDLTDLIEQWRADSSQVDWKKLVEDIEDRPPAVFAVAATLALISNDWSNGVRFAELAVRASAAGETPSISNSSRREAEFLAVLARRFRLGNLAAHIPTSDLVEKSELSQRSIEVSYNKFTLARTRLGKLIGEHDLKIHETVGIQPSKEFQHVLMMRGRSERAALNLFMAANLIASIETTDLGWLKDATLELIAQAESDIEVCWKGEGEVGSQSIKYLDRVRRQYVPNTAAAGVLRYLVEQKPREPDTQRAAQVARIRLFMGENDNLLPLLRAELSLFLTLAGDADTLVRKTLKEAVDAKQVAPLALDRWLLREIRKAALPLFADR